MKFFRRCIKFFADLWKGPGNAYWDLGRIAATISILSLIGGQLWNIHLGKEIDLGPGGFGGGLAALVTACAVLIAAKDIARAKVIVG